MQVRKWPVIGFILAVLWLFVRGVELQPTALLGELLIGLLVGLPMAFALRRFYTPTVDLGRNLRAIPPAIHYLLRFIWEVIVSGADMAYRVLHPGLPIKPDVVEVPLRVQNDAGVTTIANSITLTPGTVTMDHDQETNTLYVHGVTGRRQEDILAPIRRWEDLLLIIFDEEAKPSDSPPAPPNQRSQAAKVVDGSVPEDGKESENGGSANGS